MMDAITAFDAIVVVLLILSTLMAFARGFMRELATLGAFIAALAAAYYANKYLHSAFARFLPQDTPAYLPSLILFLAFFLLVYVIVAWFGANLSRSIQGVEGIGMLDRVTHRSEMRDELISIVRMLMGLPPAVKGDLPAPTLDENAEAAPDPQPASSDAKTG